MILENNKTDVIVTGDVQENNVRVDMKNLDHVIMLLSSNLYSNPEESFLRETISNGIDSTIEANNNEPVILKFWWNVAASTFAVTIRDYGTGISPERFQEIYLSIGASTKRSSNAYIGSFGIGRFSSLACSDAATIVSYYNGIKYTYLMIRNAGKINIDAVNQEPTNEPNGVEITINQDSLYKYSSAVSKLLYFKNLYVDYANDAAMCSDLKATIDWLHEVKIIEKNNFYIGYSDKSFNWRVGNTDLNSYKFYLTLGNVIYPYDPSYIPEADDSWSLRDILHVIQLKFDIGDLDITPNREQLLYSEKTIFALKKKCQDAIEELIDIANEDLNKNYTDLIDYFKKINCHSKKLLFEPYEIPAEYIFKFTQGLYKYNGIVRDASFMGTLSNLFYETGRSNYTVIFNHDRYIKGYVNKREIISPSDMCKKNPNFNIYLCSKEDYASNYFKGYLSTLDDGLVYTITSYRDFIKETHCRADGTKNIAAIHATYKYIMSHAIYISKDDENYKNYVEEKRNDSVKAITYKPESSIRCLRGKWGYYNGFNVRTEYFYPKDLFNKISFSGVSKHKSNKCGIVFYTFVDDECWDIIQMFNRSPFDTDAVIWAFPKKYHKFIEGNKPATWINLENIINLNNRKIIIEFTYRKCKELYGGISDLYDIMSTFVKYINYNDAVLLKDLNNYHQLFTNEKTSEIVDKWYNQFCKTGKLNEDVIEQFKVVKKYRKLFKRLTSLRQLFAEGSIMLMYVAMKNKLLRINYNSYKTIKNYYKIDKDENN
jgi:hypothetical protein